MTGVARIHDLIVETVAAAEGRFAAVDAAAGRILDGRSASSVHRR